MSYEGDRLATPALALTDEMRLAVVRQEVRTGAELELRLRFECEIQNQVISDHFDGADLKTENDVYWSVLMDIVSQEDIDAKIEAGKLIVFDTFESLNKARDSVLEANTDRIEGYVDGKMAAISPEQMEVIKDRRAVNVACNHDVEPDRYLEV